jgi:signal peptidase
VIRAALRFALFTVAGFAGGIALAFTLPLAFDARPLTVLSGSMEPALDTGDISVVKRIAPLDARPGDIVTFEDPDEPGRLITHRVRRMSARGGAVQFETRGDANNASERWQVAASGEISRVIYRIPELGRVLLVARTSSVLPFVLGAALLLLLALELVAIWRPDRSGRTGDDASPA